MNDTATIPPASLAIEDPDARAHLIPPETKKPRKLSRPMLFALGSAALFHLLLAALILARIPGLQVPLPTGLPPHTAEVEMIQDNAANTSDAKTGEGRLTQQTAPPPPPSPPPPSTQPEGGPQLPTDAHGETPPPGPPTPQQAATAQPIQPPQMQLPKTPTPPLPQTPQQADQDSKSAPEIRLGTEDEGEQAAGGEADHPSGPDPNMPNLKPAYPIDAARRGESGTVDMLVHVAPDGQAIDVMVANSSGSHSLDTAASSAVKHWRFRPAVQNGKAIDSYAPVELNFVLKH